MNCGDCILLRAALRNRRSRLLFANYIRAFRAFSRSKNLTAVYAYRKAQETKFYRKLSPNLKSFFGDVFSQDKENECRRTSVLQAKFDAVFGKLSPNIKSFFGDVFSQDKENESRRTSVLQAKFDAVFGRLSPNPSTFFGDVFSQDKENERRRTVGTPSEI